MHSREKFNDSARGIAVSETVVAGFQEVFDAN
jgi:hypothetical protein